MINSRRSPEPLPCKALTGNGSPNPSDHRFPIWASASTPSTLFATRITGTVFLRMSFTTDSSSSVSPTFASTTKRMRSAWSIAI